MCKANPQSNKKATNKLKRVEEYTQQEFVHDHSKNNCFT